MAKITNTLTRFHKIAERIAQKRQQLADAVIGATQPQCVEAAVLAVRGEAMRTKAQKALDEDFVAHDRLVLAHVTIRNALAEANITHGVSRILAEQEGVKRRISLLQGLVGQQDGAVSQEEAAAIHAARAKDEGQAAGRMRFETVSITSVSVERQAELAKALAAAEQKLARLTDDLADANANRISVELDDLVAKEILGDIEG